MVKDVKELLFASPSTSPTPQSSVMSPRLLTFKVKDVKELLFASPSASPTAQRSDMSP